MVSFDENLHIVKILPVPLRKKEDFYSKFTQKLKHLQFCRCFVLFIYMFFKFGV